MKSTHEPFDDELRRRLLNYTEEPNRHIWHNILPRIDSFNPEPRWVVWITRLSVLVIGLSGIFFLTDSVRNPVDKTFYQTFSGVTATDSSRAQVPFYPPGESVPGKRNPDLNRTVNGMPAGPSKQQEQLTSSLLRNASGKRENLPVIEETDPALAGPEDLTVNSGLILQDPATARAVVDMHSLRMFFLICITGSSIRMPED